MPSIGSVFAIIGFWQKDPRVIKLFNLPCVTLWLIYNVLSGSIANSIANAISIATIIVSLAISLVDYLKKKDDTQELAVGNTTAEEKQ